MFIWDNISQHTWRRNCNLPVIQEAQERMRHISIPTHIWDIFSRSQIALCKILHDPEIRQNILADIPMSILDSKLKFTSEQYFVDKYLSSRIPTEFLERVFEALPKAVEEDIKSTNCNFTRDLLFCYVVDNVLPNKAWRQETVQEKFVKRIISRLQLEEELKLFAQPEFSTVELPEGQRKNLELQISWQKERTHSSFLGVDAANLPEGEQKKCSDYSTRFFNASHQRVLTELQRRWELDKAERAKDENALLLNLTTLEGFEEEISKKREQLHFKTTTAVTIAIATFFFAESVLSFMLKRAQN